MIGTNDITYNKTIELEGNVIDFVVLQNRMSIFYSMDTVHEKFSTSTLVGDEIQKSRRSTGALTVDCVSARWREDNKSYEKLITSMQLHGKGHSISPENDAAKGKSLKDLLYGIENLRKRVSE